MTACAFCGKPANKEFQGKHVCKACAREIIIAFKDDLKHEIARIKVDDD